MSIKSTLFAAIAGIFTVFFAYFKGGQAAKNKIKDKTEEARNEYLEEGIQDLNKGLKREREEINKPIDYEKRDHFE